MIDRLIDVTIPQRAEFHAASFVNYDKELSRHRHKISYRIFFVCAAVTASCLVAMLLAIWCIYNAAGPSVSIATIVGLGEITILSGTATLAFWTLSFGFHQYEGNAKRMIRSVTIEHLRTASDRLRERERQILQLFQQLGSTGFAHDRHCLLPPKLNRTYTKSENYVQEREDAKALFREFYSLASTDDIVIMNHHAEYINEHYGLRSSVRQMLDGMEELAAATARKCYGFVLIDAMAGAQVVDTFLRWQTFIMTRRKSKRHANAFDQLEWLSYCIVAYRAMLFADQLRGAVSGDKECKQWLDDYYELPIEEQKAQLAWVLMLRDERLGGINSFVIPRNRVYRRRDESRLSCVVYRASQDGFASDNCDYILPILRDNAPLKNGLNLELIEYINSQINKVPL